MINGPLLMKERRNSEEELFSQRAAGFKPTTSWSRCFCSTATLQPYPKRNGGYKLKSICLNDDLNYCYWFILFVSCPIDLIQCKP